MDFRILEERLELAEAVRDYLAGTHGPEVLRRLDVRKARDPQIWSGLVEMGLTRLLVPEDHGGLGLDLLDAALIARECGRVALAEPLVDTAFVAVPWLIARGEETDLAAIASGEKAFAPAHSVNAWQADGSCDRLESVDPLRRLSRLPEDASDDRLLLDIGALMAAAQLVGLGEAMLDQAIEYSKIREQFGQQIGGFQAIKHKLADVALALEFARPVIWRAAQAMVDGLTSASLHVSHAKVAATDAAMLSAESAIQVHGAMGYTYEVDLHYWMKRCWALAGAWGAQAFHQNRVDDAVLSDRHPIGPQHTFA
ncbi:acyl-CoA dehydrogenase family protein [Parafrankia sp. BMG5.11]|uniref:acyl-CoA dehydrogenase family protein n=1 Tax=Parafrankia sp. BMG5.11 TaxID=222540 RepID=UPI00103E96F5|nr:acyl-CoA dehydrogenase family protein [Parafrankia sp. BMG5.11]TCJ37044.1 acyl-CoA dehydrogenase [Parafrankia sp. BMG5.11]